MIQCRTLLKIYLIFQQHIHCYFKVYINDHFHVYNWNNDIIDTNLTKTIENKNVIHIKPTPIMSIF
jgi:hypothetical protein